MSTTTNPWNPASLLLGTTLALGAAVIAVFLGAAAGLTISVSLPAAFVSMALLSWFLRRGEAAENAVVQVIASTAAAAATASVFLAPAFLISDLWQEVPFWSVALMILGGGISGVIFATHFRHSWKENGAAFRFPEAEACARLLLDTTKSGSTRTLLFSGLGIGALVKFLSGFVGVLRSSVEMSWTAGRTVFYAGMEASPALLGVGYLAGSRTATALFVGSVTSWFIALPLASWNAATLPDPLGWTWLTWNTRLRYLGIGALCVAAGWALFQSRSKIKSGVRGILGSGGESSSSDTDLSTGRRVLLLAACAAALGIAGWLETGSLWLAALGMGAALAFSLVASVAAGALAGLAGASLVPVSALGLGILLSSGPMLEAISGVGRTLAPLLLLIAFSAAVGGLVAGTLTQSFRLGTLCGTSPARMEGGALLGVSLAAVIVSIPLRYLHFAYGTGTGGRSALTPTQANLFAGVARSLSAGGELPWAWMAAGAGVAVALILVDEALRARQSKFRLPILAAALGMYVPLSLALPVCIGGWLSKLAGAEGGSTKGTAFASGLIAGDAVVGVAVGAMVAMNPQWVPVRLLDSSALGIGAMAALAVSLTVFAKKR